MSRAPSCGKTVHVLLHDLKTCRVPIPAGKNVYERCDDITQIALRDNDTWIGIVLFNRYQVINFNKS